MYTIACISMGVSLSQYRAAIGHFYLKINSVFNSNTYHWSLIHLSLFFSWYISQRKLMLSNDIGRNPGPVTNYNPIKICHTNVRSIVAELDSNYKRLNERPPKVIELESLVQDNSY